MLVDRVHAAVPDQAHEMDRAPALLRRVARGDEDRVAEEGPISNGVVDAHEVLHHEAPGTQVEMPDFAIAHLSLGEPDGPSRGVEQCSRVVGHEGVPRGRIGERDGVAFALGAVSPAIEYHQNHRRSGGGTFCHNQKFIGGVRLAALAAGNLVRRARSVGIDPPGFFS